MSQENTAVFFPLRSNLGWFQTSNLQQELQNQIKQSLLIYDTICIEKGTFINAIMESEDGKLAVSYSLCYPYGAKSIPAEFFGDGINPDPKCVLLSINKIKEENNTSNAHPSFSKECNILARFKVDYGDIFRGVNFNDYDFIKFIEFNGDDSSAENKRIELEQEIIPQDSDFEDSFLESNFHKAIHPDLVLSTFNDTIIENLSYDILSAVNLRSTIILDTGHRGFLEGKFSHSTNKLKAFSSYRTNAIQTFLKMPAPNFSKLSIQETLELRDSRGWQDLRYSVSRVASSIKESLETADDPKALDDLIHYECDKAILAEIEKMCPSRSELTIDLALGIISLVVPSIGVLSTLASMGKSIKDYEDHRHNWMAFLMSLQRYR